MNDWGVVFLGVIALSVAVMAAVQVGVIVYGARLAKRVEQLATQVDKDIKPLLENINAMSEEAARAAALAAAQVERADRLFASLTDRVEATASTLQAALLAPAREGLALIAGIRAALGVVKDARRRRPGPTPVRQDDEEALFIG